jgi:hypothetical protein
VCFFCKIAVVVWGVVFALFAYERWKTPRKQLMKDDDNYQAGFHGGYTICRFRQTQKSASF